MSPGHLPPPGGRSSGHPTIADVARLAEVSIATASKALNGRKGTGAATADRVREAADRLGYRPNALARGLLAGRSFTVGLITSDSFGRFSFPVLLGAEDAFGGDQVSVFLCDGRGDPVREQHYLRTLLERRVDGIIVTARRQDPRPPIGRGLPVPVVYAITQTLDPEDGVSVVADDVGGAALAVRHLATTGRRFIGHITGPERFLAARDRAAGAAEELRKVGLDLAGGGALFGEWTEEWGRQATSILLRQAREVDAIFCGNDQIARGVAEVLREMGRRVPDDVALVGFDNWEVLSACCRPPLSSVDMNLWELGGFAARTLLDQIAGRSAVGVYKRPCKLVLRESSRAARGAG